MPRRSKRKLSSSYTTENCVRLVRGGGAYFQALIDIINNAKENIHLQTYIYRDDATGKKVADALMAAARRSVDVYLIADGYASRTLSDEFVTQLAESGVHFRFFEPVFRSRSFYFGRRLHHKVIVADAAVAMVGGINISDHYNDMPGQPGWLDFAVYAEGDIASQLCILCCKTWKGYQSGKFVTSCRQTIQLKPDPGKVQSLVRMRRNDWVNRKNQISKTYVEMLTRSKSHITILCSYFLPGRVFRKNLRRAISRGIKIKVIVAGKSDLTIAKNAERWMYDWLLRNGIEIYEYQKNILHGKMAVCDSEWLTLGSYNINDISAYASVELNLDIKDPAFAADLEQLLATIIQDESVPVSRESHTSSKNLFIQFYRWCSYHVFKATLFLFTFYFRQRV